MNHRILNDTNGDDVEVKRKLVCMHVEAMVESCHQDRNLLDSLVYLGTCHCVVDTICMQQVSLLNTQNDPRFRLPILGWTIPPSRKSFDVFCLSNNNVPL